MREGAVTQNLIESSGQHGTHTHKLWRNFHTKRSWCHLTRTASIHNYKQKPYLKSEIIPAMADYFNVKKLGKNAFPLTDILCVTTSCPQNTFFPCLQNCISVNFGFCFLNVCSPTSLGFPSSSIFYQHKPRSLPYTRQHSESLMCCFQAFLFLLF